MYVCMYIVYIIQYTHNMIVSSISMYGMYVIYIHTRIWMVGGKRVDRVQGARYTRPDP